MVDREGRPRPRATRRDEPMRDGDELQAGPARVPPDVMRGTYANGIRSFGTGNEVILDFSLVVPAEHRVNERDETLRPRLVHEVVSRVIVPRAIFEDWFGKLEQRRQHEREDAEAGSDARGTAEGVGEDIQS